MASSAFFSVKLSGWRLKLPALNNFTEEKTKIAINVILFTKSLDIFT